MSSVENLQVLTEVPEGLATLSLSNVAGEKVMVLAVTDGDKHASLVLDIKRALAVKVMIDKAVLHAAGEPAENHGFFSGPRPECANHRGPEGPNEDLAQCWWCGGPTWSIRPMGQTFGWHIEDCSLPIQHEGRCAPGGTGHVMPEGWLVRG